MTQWDIEPFKHGSTWIRADFHLHTKADKEFKYLGEENAFCTSYVEHLKNADIRLGVITNHNKFDINEFKALRKKARAEGIYLLPGIELSVNDGANGVHTLIIFSDDWLEGGQDYINQFLNVAFSGKVASQYEQENARSNYDLLTTLQKLEEYNRDFFVVFAHVEAPSGIWKEIAGGRMAELAEEPLIKKYCLGFQKVRTHDKSDSVCRTKVQQWWSNTYPAELEGSDPKTLENIGQGKKAYLKLGDFNFEAVKFALQDHTHRVSKDVIKFEHSYIKSIRFEGGFLNGQKIHFSGGLNSLIGIRGSGKSAILESIRYVLGIQFGNKSQDTSYKENLLPYILRSGGKIILEVIDRLGNYYEIHRILNGQPDIYVNGKLRAGIAIQQTILHKPLYFGQKDLSATGEGFGSDLVEKLVGEQLETIRFSIEEKRKRVSDLVSQLNRLQSDSEQKTSYENQLKNVNYKLEMFQQYGISQQLEAQISYQRDIQHCLQVESYLEQWYTSFDLNAVNCEQEYLLFDQHTSTANADFFNKYKIAVNKIPDIINKIKSENTHINNLKSELSTLRKALEEEQSLLKEGFAKVEREMSQELQKQGVTAIQPDDYVQCSHEKDRLTKLINAISQKDQQIELLKQKICNGIIELNNDWHEEFKFIQTRLDSINSTQGALKVLAVFKGDKNSFINKMDDTFKGSSIRKDVYQTLANKYSDFCDIYRDLDTAILEARTKSEVLRNQFLSNLSDLLTYQVPNIYEVTYHGKPLKSHSIGQRASAMMLFILSQRENDVLLIDQPEDDLDSEIIYKEVIKILRQLKSNQQFIFATHNANFPVLGDAELVIACSFDNETMLTQGGSIDCKQTQQKIVDIMEGGIEAFNRRKNIYQIWKTNTNI